MKPTPFVLACIMLISLTSLQAQDTVLISTLKAHQYKMKLVDGKLAGAGATFLQSAASTAQFVLIGEDHGIAELPQFTAALFDQLRPAGYQYFATETGPYTAAFLQDLGQQANFVDLLRDTYLKNPWTIPFYNLREEAEMLQQIIGDRQTDLPIVWGLDQEFICSPRLLFPQLIAAAKSEAATANLQAYLKRFEEGLAETLKTRNPSSLFFYSATSDDFADIRSNLNNDQNAHDLLNELEESWEIYHKIFNRKGYASNQQRAELMKRHFWQYYQQAKETDPKPKVVFKFGANHTYRGANALHVFDIGNFVSEVASQEGTGSLHLYVIGKKGTQNRFNPFTDEAAKRQPYDAKNYLDEIDVSPILDLTNTEDWCIFDLRPLRTLLFNKVLKDLDPALEKVIWSYDAYVVIPEVHASSNLDE